MTTTDKTEIFSIIIGAIDGFPSDCAFRTTVRATDLEEATQLALAELRDHLRQRRRAA